LLSKCLRSKLFYGGFREVPMFCGFSYSVVKEPCR